MRLLRFAFVVPVLATTVAACNSDSITELNRNPNVPTDAPAGPVFTSAARSVFSNWTSGVTAMPVLVQHLSEFQYPTHDLYQGFTSGDMSEYSGSLINLAEVVVKGEALKAPGIYAPAQILSVIDFHHMTDQVGDIPYSQALRGTERIFSPEYDTQKAIYTGLLATLAKATSELAAAPAGAPTLGSADPVYGGNLIKWQRFSNSLRLRLAMRVVNVDPALADQEIRAALAAPGGLILVNADNAALRWPGDNAYNNSWANTAKSRDDVRMARLMVDFLKDNKDPRLSIYAMPVVGTTDRYVGKPPGLEPGAAASWGSTSSRYGAAWYPGVTTAITAGGKGAAMPSWLLTAAEVNLTLAEAAERGMAGLSAGQARGYYDAGVTQSIQQFSDEVVRQALPLAPPNGSPASAAQITTYLAGPGVAYQGGVAGLRQIATQKWVAFFTQGDEAWSEWRRTCEPAGLLPGPDAVLSAVPRRFPYPLSEGSLNQANLGAAIARQGPDNFETRVWWDSKPSAAPTCR